MQIFLTYFECLQACQVGLTRHLESCLRSRKARFPETKADELLLHHQHGALAEMAYSKLTSQYWGYHVNHFHAADLGSKTEVRWSERSDLKVRPDDNDIIVVSMSGKLSDCIDKRFPFVYNGWIHSNDAKQEQWKRDFHNAGKPAYFVPHDNLNKELPNEK